MVKTGKAKPTLSPMLAARYQWLYPNHSNVAKAAASMQGSIMLFIMLAYLMQAYCNKT